MSKFIVYSQYGELLDLALHLQGVEKHEVVLYIPSKEYEKIGEGLVKKVKNWWECVGKDYLWVFDSCDFGELQDWLRGKGEKVFGGSALGDKLENNRQLGQKLFKAAGFLQPESKNFKDFDSAIQFVTKSDKQWVMKQNGDAPKSINYVGKFDGNEDMLFHLQEMKKSWNEAEFGKVDFDLMEKVKGLEVAASAFFNGTEFVKDENRKVCGFLNYEEKKESDGGMGETVGETGTTFVGVNEDVADFKNIIVHEEFVKVLASCNFRGVFDVNCIKTDKGIVALESTSRPGIPATSYEFLEGLAMNTGEMLEAVASGSKTPIKLVSGPGMVVCVMSKPYPVEADMEKEATSIGEKLWIIQDRKLVEEFSDEQRKHIHLYNFHKEEGVYRVATKNGYLLTVTGSGKTIGETRKNVLKYIHENFYIAGIKYRTDIGKRVEDYYGINPEEKIKKAIVERVESDKKKSQDEVDKIKATIKDIIYKK